MPVTTDFAGTETLAETKSRLGTLLTAYGYDSSGYSTWGDARTDLNSALTAIEETTISDGELASSFRSKLNALNAWSDYPAGGKVPNLVFDFEDEYYRANDTETTFGDSITFSRASSATYVDSDGVLQTAASGVPRIGHHVWNGSAWVNEGLLHESEQRVNFVVYSEDSSQWSEDGTATITNSTQTAPDGTSSATLVDIGATGSSLGPNRISQAGTGLSAGSTYTASVFFKQAPSNAAEYICLRAFCAGTANTDAFVNWNTATGQVSNSNAGVLTANDAVDFGNGWWRASFSFVLDASATGAFSIRAGGPISVDSNTGTDFILWGMQLEAGSTPSSYIPTSGSTVTRAAETLTVPAAKLPWPTPNVIGPELVTNGTFDTDTSGWSGARSNETLSIVSGRLRSTAVSAGTYGAVSTLSGLTIGNVYRVQGQVFVDGGPDVVYLRVVGTSNLNTTVPVNGSSNLDKTYDIVFVATATTMYVGGINVAASAGDYFELDNISVREIDPLSVSIQMDGRVTYADEGVSLTVEFLSWSLDANNRILNFLNTSSAETGETRFSQRVGGTNTVVDETTGSYTPGILVPYNIASRHGSTFINGAVDGTEIGVDTTPVALPDLSATDLSLGHDYMGTIRTFRMWDQDIGDSGIEEASA